MNLKIGFFVISAFLSASTAWCSDIFPEEPGSSYTAIKVYDSEENPQGMKIAVTNAKGEDSIRRLPFTSITKAFEHHNQDHLSVEKTTYKLQIGTQAFSHVTEKTIPHEEKEMFFKYILPGGGVISSTPNFFELNLWDLVIKEENKKFQRLDGVEYEATQSKTSFQSGPLLNDAFVERTELPALRALLPDNQYVPVVLKVSEREKTYVDKDAIQYYLYKKVLQEPAQGTVTICHQHGKEKVWGKGTQVRHARKYYFPHPVTTGFFKALYKEEREPSLDARVPLIEEQQKILLVLNHNPHPQQGTGYQEKIGGGHKNSSECSGYNFTKQPNFGLPANYEFAS